MQSKVISLLMAMSLILVLSCNKDETPVGNTVYVPSSPQMLTAIPGNKITTLSWQAPTNGGGSVITNYKIYRGLTSGGQFLHKTVSGNLLNFVDSSLTNGTKYYYYVTALNSAGESNASNEAFSTPFGFDTLYYTYNNFNDSILTISYAVGGTTSSQMVSWSYPSVNLMKNPLNIRINMMHLSSGSMMIQLLYENSTDTLRRQAFTISTAKDSTRTNITGPANRINLTPTNFMGRGTITVFK